MPPLVTIFVLCAAACAAGCLRGAARSQYYTPSPVPVPPFPHYKTQRNPKSNHRENKICCMRPPHPPQYIGGSMIPPYLFQQVETTVPDFLAADRSRSGDDGGRGQGLPRGRSRRRRRRNGLLGNEQRLDLVSPVSMMSTVRIQAEVLLWVLLADAVSRFVVERSSRVLQVLLLPDAGQMLPVREGCT